MPDASFVLVYRNPLKTELDRFSKLHNAINWRFAQMRWRGSGIKHRPLIVMHAYAFLEMDTIQDLRSSLSPTSPAAPLTES
ncbi:hypothetical protein BC938DRAFT_478625 [Jimgerdemannia flammicorona]|uniref:Uncharacterized protein n=1 Tax=Jimgerdemannia flammicorona TaxID=994334 RepID=A0A433QML7_9FUNG|nr:hypothetical protein BC938DRAFT_478625 [Jimgerdemannia flammicorona]